MTHHRAQPTTIAHLESDLQSALEALRELDRQGQLAAELRPLLWIAPPDGSSVHVSLRQRESGRQLRRALGVDAWVPRHSAVWVVYEVPQNESPAHDPSTGEPMTDFILALDHAERDPHLSFIALKWFRDTYLQKRGYAWAMDPDMPRRLIQEATEAGVLVMHKVPNPKQPEFPVTGIRLERANPMVQAILSAVTQEEAQIANTRVSVQ